MYSLLMHTELQKASNKNKGLIYWKSQDGVYLGGIREMRIQSRKNPQR